MSVWRNEQDFMRNMDNMLSEFYIKDKKVTAPKKLNVQTQKQDRLWYDSESDDDINEKPQNADGSSKCPSMEPMDTLQMMQSIRTQVRNVSLYISFLKQKTNIRFIGGWRSLQ